VKPQIAQTTSGYPYYYSGRNGRGTLQGSLVAGQYLYLHVRLGAEAFSDAQLQSLSVDPYAELFEPADQSPLIFDLGGASTYSLTASGSDLALTSGAAALTKDSRLNAAGADLALAGGAAGIARQFRLTAAGGDLTATSETVSLLRTLLLTANGGALALGSLGAELSYAPGGYTYTLTANGAGLDLAGGAAALSKASRLAASGGELALAGGAASLDLVYVLHATGADLAASGGAAALTKASLLVAAGASLTVTGGTGTLRYSGAAPPLAALTVTLLHPDGTPIEGAVVTATLDRGQAAEPFASSATTDDAGVARLDLSPNTAEFDGLGYWITATLDGVELLACGAVLPEAGSYDLRDVANFARPLRRLH